MKQWNPEGVHIEGIGKRIIKQHLETDSSKWQIFHNHDKQWMILRLSVITSIILFAVKIWIHQSSSDTIPFWLLWHISHFMNRPWAINKSFWDDVTFCQYCKHTLDFLKDKTYKNLVTASDDIQWKNDRKIQQYYLKKTHKTVSHQRWQRHGK